MDEKSRLLYHTVEQPWTNSYNPNWGVDPTRGDITSGVFSRASSLEKTSSRGHAWPSAGGSFVDRGGNFSTIKVTTFSPSSTALTQGRGYGRMYTGPEYAVSPGEATSYALLQVPLTSDLNLMQKGSTAISRCLPTNPTADAATFLGELKMGLPKMVGKELFKTKLKDSRKLGSEYLNVSFGWMPLVSDLMKFTDAAQKSDKILKQLHRDSGKPIRRRYTFPEEVSVKSEVFSNRRSSSGGLSLYSGIYHSTGGATLRRITTTTTKTWFSGCFTYHLNLGNTIQDRSDRIAAEARKLYGLELTPSVVWNLAPWSWIVDWETNVGDVLHNYSRFLNDGLVMRYGYVMQEKTAKVDYTLSWPGRLNGSPMTDLHLTVTAVSKLRRRATPFGFGFDMSALTGRQTAILGALGIARGPRAFN